MRAPGEEDIYENRLTAIIANLPVHVANPIDRLTAVRTELATLKASGEAMVGEAMISLGRYTPFLLTSAAARIAYGLPQREIVTVTTNVPDYAGAQSPHGAARDWDLRPSRRAFPSDLDGSGLAVRRDGFRLRWSESPRLGPARSGTRRRCNTAPPGR